ncbi:MAG: acyltransferase family protein [Anaerolineales bacterium]|nr:acyltransferase family protein [Anaerolineales bacterium]MCZ2123076.1 acyltransferase family protein [Anaerolineales bacterium]
MLSNNDSQQIKINQRWLDLIRALGAFLVVVAHSNVFFQGKGWGPSSEFYFGMTRSAVPLFFMASGYLLLSKNETLIDFFRKRLSKLLVPFVVWSVVYLIWKEEGFGKSIYSIVWAYIIRIANRPSEQHLWFLYEIFGLYLFTPILRLYLQKAKKLDLYYFLAAWFILIPFVFFLREFTPINLGLSYPFLGGYIGYFLFGHFAGRFLENPNKRIAWIFYILGSLITVSGLWYRALYHVKSQYYEEYLSMNVVIMSWSLFVLLKDIQISDRLYKFIIPLKNTSFGVYLVHMIVITELFTREPLSILTKIGSGAYIPFILGLIGFIVSFIVVYILQKIPILKNIVPA